MFMECLIYLVLQKKEEKVFGVSLTERGFNRIQKGLNILLTQDWAAFYGEVRSQGCVIPASQKAVVSGFQ